jgi:L-threonine kinase
MSEAVSLIETGLLRGNPLFIGKGATISAIANQEVSFNPYLDDVLAFSAEVGGYGVNVAHSGTVIGILLPDQPSLVTHTAAQARRRFDCLESTMRCRVKGGGVKLR